MVLKSRVPSTDSAAQHQWIWLTEWLVCGLHLKFINMLKRSKVYIFLNPVRIQLYWTYLPLCNMLDPKMSHFLIYALRCKRGKPQENTTLDFPPCLSVKVITKVTDVACGPPGSSWITWGQGRVFEPCSISHLVSKEKAFFWNGLHSNNTLEQTPKVLRTVLIQIPTSSSSSQATEQTLFDLHMSFVRFWLVSNEVTYLAAGNLHLNYRDSCPAAWSACGQTRHALASGYILSCLVHCQHCRQ